MATIREIVARNSAGTAILALLLVGVSAVCLASWMRPSSADRPLRPRVYFYDLNTKELFPVPADTVPPIETDSGPHRGLPAGVRAHVFTYDTGPNAEWFIGYLETTVASLPADERPQMDSELVLRDVDGERWCSPADRGGQKVLEGIRQRGRSKGRTIKVVHPLPVRE
jgi:hypothetical protein